MRSKTLAFAVVAIGLVSLCGAVWFVYLSGPSLKVTRTDQAVTVEPYFLEYNLGLTKFQLEDSAEHHVLLEGVSESGTEFSAVRLNSGPMSARTAAGASAIAASSPLSQTVLLRGHPYRLTVWGNNGFGHVNATSISFAL